MCVSSVVIDEMRRIIKSSEIMKYVELAFPPSWREAGLLTSNREDDKKWPQKNKDGRQELEIRLGNEHVSFEVRSPP